MAGLISLITDFDPAAARQWMTEHRFKSVWLAFAYAAFIIAGQRYMKKRTALSLNRPLIAWNAFLTIFSIAGTWHTWPEFIHAIKQFGFVGSYCTVSDYYTNDAQSFWVWAFHFSKAFELVDTVFLVLRKRPVIFLHSYHHFSVLIWCWCVYPHWTSPPRWGAAMNYFVHCFMYAYYLARATRIKLPGFIAQALTAMQIAQFFSCLLLNCVALARIFGIVEPSTCDTTLSLALIQHTLYCTYLFLFVKLFNDSYISKKKVD